MTTEREQLVLAAKACGLKHKSTDELSQWLLVEGVRTPLQGAHRWYWNPLADDGDMRNGPITITINLDAEQRLFAPAVPPVHLAAH